MLLGLTAWTMWGFFPLYWPLLEPSGAVEILTHRIFWSMIVMLGVVVALRKWDSLRATVAQRRTRWLLVVAAALITINWGTYIWGVNNHHVVETSLGYFINPLVSVLIGVVVLGERLRRLQWAALALAAVAVLGLTVEYGRPPWVALILAFSFGLASVISGIGLAVLYARKLFTRLPSDHGRIVQVLPVASAVIITVLGLLLTARSLPGVM